MSNTKDKFVASREQIKKLAEDEAYRAKVEKNLPEGNIGQYWLPRDCRSYTSLEDIVELGY